ncbi:sigma-70 family RNA polymerase sigma factor [Alicyclobacillus acidocaldarius]|uniref:RNA polymerase sigma factor SigS n=1 Tax=Alicyclobacillus acidocaldarius (strain Tc-4-1) TaxID=1048834 RepID=F8IDD5_ALIAT|nr:sigma-70 family RNA polymerase sigma factor [Alicyclobacillus acidocaldarius]AEJ43788.1 RNA polymerase, sigma 28 subunit, FliA/WhiG family [Alicyclobacillus acidocaldarius subsp. acidocaldarius Tc-4-1]
MVTRMNDAQRELAAKNIGLVYYIARRYRYRAERLGIEFDDLVAAGLLALCRATLFYQSEVGKFVGFAAPTIARELKKLILRAGRRPLQRSILLDFEDEEEGEKHVESRDLWHEADWSVVEIREFMAGLTPRDREIVGWTVAGYSQAEIGRRLGVTQPSVCRALRRVRERWVVMQTVS